MKRHSMDMVSLVFGLLFVAVAAWWVVGYYVNVDWNIPNFGWIAAGALILLGLLGVVASLRGGEPEHLPDAAESAAEPVDDTQPVDEADAAAEAETVGLDDSRSP